MVQVLLLGMRERPKDGPGMLVERKGVAVLWMLENTGVSLGLVAKVVTILEVVPVLWVGGEDGILSVVGGEVPDRESVQLRSALEVEEPAEFMNVDWMEAGDRVDTSILSEEAGTVVDVCTIVELDTDAVKADLEMFPGNEVVEEVMFRALWCFVGMTVVTK